MSPEETKSQESPAANLERNLRLAPEDLSGLLMPWLKQNPDKLSPYKQIIEQVVSGWYEQNQRDEAFARSDDEHSAEEGWDFLPPERRAVEESLDREASVKYKSSMGILREIIHAVEPNPVFLRSFDEIIRKYE